MDIFESLENLEVSEACFDEIMGIVEELLSESSPFPKRAIENGNKKFVEKDAQKNSIGRLHRTAARKLDKEIKKYEEKNGKGSTDHIDPYWIKRNPSKGSTIYDYSKALKTLLHLSDKKREADKEFDEVNDSQRKLASENPGVVYRSPELYKTTKSDSFGFANKKKVSK